MKEITVKYIHYISDYKMHYYKLINNFDILCHKIEDIHFKIFAKNSTLYKPLNSYDCLIFCIDLFLFFSVTWLFIFLRINLFIFYKFSKIKWRRETDINIIIQEENIAEKIVLIYTEEKETHDLIPFVNSREEWFKQRVASDPHPSRDPMVRGIYFATELILMNFYDSTEKQSIINNYNTLIDLHKDCKYACHDLLIQKFDNNNYLVKWLIYLHTRDNSLNSSFMKSRNLVHDVKNRYEIYGNPFIYFSLNELLMIYVLTNNYRGLKLLIKGN